MFLSIRYTAKLKPIPWVAEFEAVGNGADSQKLLPGSGVGLDLSVFSFQSPRNRLVVWELREQTRTTDATKISLPDIACECGMLRSYRNVSEGSPLARRLFVRTILRRDWEGFREPQNHVGDG